MNIPYHSDTVKSSLSSSVLAQFIRQQEKVFYPVGIDHLYKQGSYER